VARVDLVEQPLIDYRQHGSNQIGVADPGRVARFRRMLLPREDRYRRLAARAEALAERLDDLDASAEVRELAHRKLRFERARAAYPRARLSRLSPILEANRHGAYRLLSSQGTTDIVRDLVQPA
jgi:hypothetical protein